MEPVKPLIVGSPVPLSAEAKAEYGKPSFGKTVVKYIGYGLFILFALGLICWPVFLSLGHK